MKMKMKTKKEETLKKMRINSGFLRVTLPLLDSNLNLEVDLCRGKKNW